MAKQQHIIDYLTEHGSITNSQAEKELNCGNLGSKIRAINKSGKYKIREKLVGKIRFDWHKKDQIVTEFVMEKGN